MGVPVSNAVIYDHLAGRHTVGRLGATSLRDSCNHAYPAGFMPKILNYLCLPRDFTSAHQENLNFNRFLVFFINFASSHIGCVLNQGRDSPDVIEKSQKIPAPFAGMQGVSLASMWAFLGTADSLSQAAAVGDITEEQARNARKYPRPATWQARPLPLGYVLRRTGAVCVVSPACVTA